MMLTLAVPGAAGGFHAPSTQQALPQSHGSDNQWAHGLSYVAKLAMLAYPNRLCSSLRGSVVQVDT